MGQIIGSAAKPKRCNISKLSQLGTPAAGEYYLVSSDNSMNAAGQGNFDCYIVGNGQDLATALPLKHIDSTEFFEMFGGTMEVGAGSTGSAVSFDFPVNLAAGCYELICSKGTVVSTSSAPSLIVTYQDDTTTNFSSYNTFGQKRWIYFASPVKKITYKCQVTTVGTLVLSVKPLRKTEDILKISLDTMSLLPWAFFNGEAIVSSNNTSAKQDHAKVKCRISTLEKYKFSDNVEINVADGYRYYTYSYNDDGQPITCVWETADISEKLFYKKKTYRYVALRCMPELSSSVKINAQKEGQWTELKNDVQTLKYFSYENLTYSKMTYSCNRTQRVTAAKIRLKKLDHVRFRFVNDLIDEPLGINDFAVEYTQAGNVK